MRVIVTRKNIIDRVDLPDIDFIDRTRLAKKLGISYAKCVHMAQYGFTEEYIPLLKSISLVSVMTWRKPYRRKRDEIDERVLTGEEVRDNSKPVPDPVQRKYQP